MKTNSNFAHVFLFISFGAAFILSACTDTCERTSTFVYYAPVYSTSAEIKDAVQLQDAAPLTTIGKIYFKDGMLYINDPGKGIHIIDNRNPAAPANQSFLAIPGNFDLAIRGNILYADSYVDLVAFDISNLSQINEVNRIERLFNNYTTQGYMVSSKQGVLTSWERKENVTVTVGECGIAYEPWGGFWFEGGIAFNASSSINRNTTVAPSTQNGIGGSMARFTLSDDHLYGLDGANIDVVDVSSTSNPKAVYEFALSWDIETLFPYEDKLFVGSQSGMYILDVSNPAQPTQISQYQHVRSCDPVVVEGAYAYVTLRSSSACQGFTNQLEVISLADLTNPSLIKTYPMTNPHGLGIDDGKLFICDGNDGLKIYDASDVTTISENQLAHYNTIQAFDIIPFNNVAMVIGEDGLFQYDYSDISNIRLLSSLAITKE
ncbi:MAG: hypothetical protein RIF39_05785 [Cyclobacteriaceae bacterium]